MTRYDESHWRAVAAVYVDAASKGEPTTAAVMAEFDLSSDVARNYVREARRRGLITEGRRNAKVVALAERLGLPYGEVLAAIADVAGGDIRLGR